MAYPQHIDAHEKRIISALIHKAIKVGYSISVYDGEEWPLKLSTDFDAITSEVAATDYTCLHFFLSGGDRVGMVLLIHGNGEDVISDHTDNEATAFLVEGCE